MTTLPTLPTRVSRQTAAACPDCPAARLGALADFIGETKDACTFDTQRMDTKAFASSAWPERYGFALVRRGVYIRQRVDPKGRAIAVDAAGPGCSFPIPLGDESSTQSMSYDYAATDVVLCLCRRTHMDRALERSHRAARDLIAAHAATLARVERIAQARGAPSAREKVAMLIAALADHLSPPRRREVLPPTLQQRDIAKLVGVRHETLCRVVKDLERRGILAKEDRAIRILDRPALDAV